MSDDPFARAVQRAQAAEHAETQAKRERRERAVSSGARTSFRVHFSVFVAVNLLLVAIWATTTPGYPWFLWPLLGWGVGVVAHFAAVQNHLGRRARPYPAATPVAPTPAPTPAPAPASVDVTKAAGGPTAKELSRLAELHASGVLDDDEFRAAKAKLLR
ncbi:MAG: 2TM domain-containing protein [Solirubrobacteraceae bacterium]|nr:2TM domain-containing protein [Patulibacter sp.]